MILVGENIHIIAGPVSRAIRDRNTEVIQSLAREQTEAGANYIDLNLGPARRNPQETMQWLVNTVQEVTDLPLSLDTMNHIAMEAGLQVCRKRPLLNSASGRTDSKELMLPLAKKYPTDVVISVLTDRGCPPDVESRSESIMNTVAYANEMGIPNESIWVDPIVLPVGADQKQVTASLEFMQILADLLPEVKSTVGLSNISNGSPAELRPILNQTYMVMLARNGLYSAIVDVLDAELVAINRGRRPKVVDVIHRTMDGEDIDPATLTPELNNYVKTTRVLLGQILYSHAWLEG